MGDRSNGWRQLVAASERAWQVVDFQNGAAQLDLVSHLPLFTVEGFCKLAGIVALHATTTSPLTLTMGRPSRSLSRCRCHGQWAAPVDRRRAVCRRGSARSVDSAAQRLAP